MNSVFLSNYEHFFSLTLYQDILLKLILLPLIRIYLFVLFGLISYTIQTYSDSFDAIKSISTINLNELIFSALNSAVFFVSNPDKLLDAIKVIVFLFIFVALITLVKRLYTDNKNLIIFPFEVSNLEGFTGKIISDSLVSELRRINLIQQSEHYGIKSEVAGLEFPRLSPSSEALETKISEVSEVKIGGIELSLAGIFKTLELLCPFRERGNYIQGSLQKCNSTLRVIASLEGSKAHSWDCSTEFSEDKLVTQFSELIKDLAYMIAFYIAKSDSKENIQAKTWEGLKYFTDSLDFYSKYNKTGDKKYLTDSYSSCKKALECEKDYRKISNVAYNIGIAFYIDKSYSLAKDSFQMAIKLDSNNEGCFLGLGTCLYYLGRMEEALENFDKSIEIKPNYAGAWYNKGCAFVELNRPDKELEAFNKSITFDISNHMAWFNRACTYARMEDRENSLSDLRRAIQLNKESKAEAKKEECFKKFSNDPDFLQLIE